MQKLEFGFPMVGTKESLNLDILERYQVVLTNRRIFSRFVRKIVPLPVIEIRVLFNDLSKKSTYIHTE